MEQEDYIKRQIEQLGKVLGKLLADLIRIKTSGRMSDGIEEADQALKTELDLDITSLTLIPAEAFLSSLLAVRKFNDKHFEQLADILFLIAEELSTSHSDSLRMKKLYERSLIIYEVLDKTSSTYSFERHMKIEKIKKVL
ncbi:MAG: hypothetical protein WCK92_15065 [Bacteroidota bacterium]